MLILSISRGVCRTGTGNDFVVDSINSCRRDEMEHESHIFMVLSIYEKHGGDYWTVVSKLHLVKGNHYRFKVDRESLQVLRMTDTVKKCGLMHHCAMDKGCVIGKKKKVLMHKLNYSGFINIFVLSSSTGYPFRSA